MATIKTRISDILPKPSGKMVIVNFEIDEKMKNELNKKLKSEGIKKTQFFRAIVESYLKED